MFLNPLSKPTESKVLGVKPSGNDPRLNLQDDALEDASQLAMPSVAQKGGFGDLGLAVGIIGAVGLGLLTWHFSNTAPVTPKPNAPQPSLQAPPQPQNLPPIDSSIQPEPEGITPPIMTVQPQPQPLTQSVPAQSTPQQQAEAGGRSPALIVDLSIAGSAPPLEGQAGQAAPNSSLLNRNDAFGARLNSDVVQSASRISSPSLTVSQGTVIPAVLETAINSDLPGFTRAVVSRDVRSFDGTKILIPRGSRLIGQYKSGLTSGETRAFIIWNRLIRTDGLSIQLTSPAIDELGQAGMSGKVDTHFIKRFGSAILLSIVNGLASQNNGGNTIVIGTASEAKSVATDALTNDANIAPTVKVKQGSAISVFAARDLDFSTGETR